MSVAYEPHIYCDMCELKCEAGEIPEGASNFDDIEDRLRESAASEGWTINETGDYCPECSRRRNADGQRD